MKGTRVLKSLLASLVLCVSSQSFGWGTQGHEVIDVVAAGLMPPTPISRLINNNIRNVQVLSMVPDLFWKHGPVKHELEGQSHFFNMDFYHPRGGQPSPRISEYIARFGRDQVLRNGTAPWRVQELAVLLVQVMKKPNVNPLEVLQIAATLGHYIGDLGNPLHVNSDYNGKNAGVPGLHSFFETVSVNAIPEMELRALVRAAALPMLNSIPDTVQPIQAAFMIASGSNARAPGLISAAVKYKLTPELTLRSKPLIVKTLAVSTAVLSKIWHEAWILAGSPEFSSDNLGEVPYPEWVPINYIQ